MKQHFGERDFVDEPTGYSRGGDGVIRHTSLLDEEKDDGDLWEKSTLALLLRMGVIEKELETTATASCSPRELRDIYALKLLAERLNNELDLVMRELDRRGVLPTEAPKPN